MKNRSWHIASSVIAVTTIGMAGAFTIQAQGKRTSNAPSRATAVSPRSQTSPPARPQIFTGRPGAQPARQTPQFPVRQPMRPRVVPQYRDSPVVPYSRPYTRERENLSAYTHPIRVQPVLRNVGNRTGQVVYGYDGRVQAWRDGTLSFSRTPSGSRIITAEGSDHSRVVVVPGGGWLQRSFSFRGTQYVRRSYVLHGTTVERFYRQSEYHGIALNVYTPVRYYPASFYAWAYQPWPRPVVYEWGFIGRPWFSVYTPAFQPYSYYGGTSPWLADFLVANSLEAAYQQFHSDASPAEPQAGFNGSTYQPGFSQFGSNRTQVADRPSDTIRPIPSYVKTQLAQEVQRQTAELQQDTQAGRLTLLNVGEILSDNHAHTFITGSEVVVVDSTGTECSLTAGDSVQYVPPAPLPHALAVDVQVLWGKGSLNECNAGTRVTVSVENLQEMHNYMRATVDQGLEKLRTEQANGTIPALPPYAVGDRIQAEFANGAPAPERNLQTILNQQTQQAEQTERVLSKR